MRLWIASLLFVLGFAEMEFGMYEARRESQIGQRQQQAGSVETLAESGQGFPPK